MKKLTVLNLFRTNEKKLMYQAIPILEGMRKQNSIDRFLSDDSLFCFCENNGLFTVLIKENENDDWQILIEFYKRVNQQFFGRNYASGKCVYGEFSHPWHKINKNAELTLFESEVNFEDLYHFDFHDGIYIPEFSTKVNWIQAYHAADSSNLRKSLDYATSQPPTPEFLAVLDHLRQKGLVSD